MRAITEDATRSLRRRSRSLTSARGPHGVPAGSRGTSEPCRAHVRTPAAEAGPHDRGKVDQLLGGAPREGRPPSAVEQELAHVRGEHGEEEEDEADRRER